MRIRVTADHAVDGPDGRTLLPGQTADYDPDDGVADLVDAGLVVDADADTAGEVKPTDPVRHGPETSIGGTAPDAPSDDTTGSSGSSSTGGSANRTSSTTSKGSSTATTSTGSETDQ